MQGELAEQFLSARESLNAQDGQVVFVGCGGDDLDGPIAADNLNVCVGQAQVVRDAAQASLRLLPRWFR